MIKNTQFTNPTKNDFGFVISALSNDYQIQLIQQQSLSKYSLETFDWRLKNAGYALRYEKPYRGAGQLILESTSDVETNNKVKQQPHFVDDIEAENIHALIEPIIEMRALLPLVKIKCKRIKYHILDQEQKIVARLIIDQQDVLEHEETSLLIMLQSLRGYQKDFKYCKKQLKKLPQMQLAKRSMNAILIDDLYQSKPVYTSKLNFKLKPDAPIIESAKKIHQHLLTTINVNLDGTIQNIDSEFLHDLRVAVRRTRSALTQIKNIFSDEQQAEFKENFAWIGKGTGAVRDLDVYLLAFNGYQQQLPETEQAALLPFKDFLIKQQRKEQRKLRNMLQSAQFKQKIQRWDDFLNKEQSIVGEKAQALTFDVANQQIWKLYKKVKKQGSTINSESPAEDLHDLRKTCKKLRYMMEFFQSLYPKEMLILIKQLKKLLNNLGDFQDFEMQVIQLKLFAEQMLLENTVKAETYLSIGILVKHLLDKQTQARADFQQIFNNFSKKTIKQQFKQTFKPHLS